MIHLRPYQTDGLNALWEYFQNGGTGNPLLAWPCGCHARGTKILMHDGTIKNVEDIQVGDKLIGPDSKARLVLSLARGRQSMLKVIPIKGEPFVVNKDHIFSLMTSTNQHSRVPNRGKGKIVNVKGSDYVNWSKWFKETHKLWRSSVNFNDGFHSYLPISPYNMGVFLGDGGYSHDAITITSQDEIILQSIISEAGYMRRYNNGSKANTITISTIGNFGKSLKILGLNKKNSGSKFIPQIYKTASIDDRKAILAGLLDTDGSLTCNGYDYISKSKRLAEDVCFISRSLGFASYVKECSKKSQNGTEGIYFRVSIYGKGLDTLPLMLAYKKANPSKQIKNNLVTGFKLEELPEDDFYGFALDGDHLYLTADFTVHHNTGKSIVPAIFIESVMKLWPNQRFLMITHVKELIQQNYNVLLKVWFNAPVGIYSAGLKSKEVAHSIVYGGIQSMIKNPMQFGFRDIIFIDEAHLISDEDSSMYQTFLAAMKLINPFVKIIGLTATPYRMGMGLLTDGKIFTDIVHDLTSMDNFNKLVEDGYLAPLIPLRTKIELDTTNVSINNLGEFVASSLQKSVDKQEITFEALRELVAAGQNRRSWLIFSSGIEHAEHIAEMLGSFGIDCAPVHSKRPSDYNDAALTAFKNYELRSIVSYSKITTGFDHTGVDLIGDLMPTLSIPRHVQKYGRGERPVYADGYDLETKEGRLEAIKNGPKQNCLVLDYARNTLRLGPINDPQIPKKKGEGSGEVPIKICDNCGAYNHTRVQFCCNCGNEFQFQIKFKSKAGTEELIRTTKVETPIIEPFNVDRVIYHRHVKMDKKTKAELSAPMLKVQYLCGLRTFNEYVGLQHTGLVLHKAREWWRARAKDEPPLTTDEALKRLSELRVPKKIMVHVNKDYPDIKSVEW